MGHSTEEPTNLATWHRTESKENLKGPMRGEEEEEEEERERGGGDLSPRIALTRALGSIHDVAAKLSPLK